MDGNRNVNGNAICEDSGLTPFRWTQSEKSGVLQTIPV